MATTYTAAKVAAGIQEREVHTGVIAVCSTYTITAAFVINDVVQMVKVPYGARIINCKVTVPALDSSTGLVWALGDGGDDDRYITGATTGRSGAAGLTTTNTTTSEYTYTTEDTIDFKVTTAATGTAATTGDIVVTVTYTMTP
jgi:hypothetical protein